MIAAALPFLLASAACAGENGRVTAPAVETESTAALPEPDRLALGVNDLGAQLRLRVARNWAAEARFMTGSASSNEGDIHSLVFGLRGYRFFPERHRCRLYLGLEGDRVQTSIRGGGAQTSSSPTGGGVAQASGFGDASGYAAGGFAGVELRPLRRVAVDLDMGPYLIGLKEKITGDSVSNWDFVANFAVDFYFF